MAKMTKESLEAKIKKAEAQNRRIIFFLIRHISMVFFALVVLFAPCHLLGGME